MIGPDEGDLAPAIAALLREAGSATDDDTVAELEHLTGGANMETWRFELQGADRSVSRPLILRRRPAGMGSHAMLPAPLTLATEARLLSLARRAGVPVPTVLAISKADSDLGEALVMTCLNGEALPQRLLRAEDLVTARQRLAFQCGESLGRLHSISPEDLPDGMRDLSWHADLDRLQSLSDYFGNVSPAHQLAINWLRRQPTPQSPRVLCHGDFRNGNLLVGSAGLQGVLDWELAHVGFAAEDLGYLCARVWRFGGQLPVGGFGSYEDLLAGYCSIGGYQPTIRELQFWELYAALGWGMVCLTMLELHRSGADPGLERAAVGRRLCESEIDILLLLEDLDS